MRNPTFKLLAAAGSLLLGMMLLIAAPSPTSADTPDIWRNNATRRCIHNDGTARTRMTPSCSAQYEGHLWHVHRVTGTAYYRIVSNVDGDCWSQYDIYLELRQCGTTGNLELWELEDWANGRWTIRNVSTNACVYESSSYNRPLVSTCDGGNTRFEWVRS